MAGAVIASLLVPATARAQVVNPPAPAAPRKVNVPQPVEKTLANGLRVIVISKRDVPLVAASLVIRNGSESDPAGRAGLAQLTAAALMQGTKKRTAEQIAQGIEALGATVQSDAGWDSSSVELSVMSSKLQPAMEYVADVVRNATFANEEVERLRQQTLDALRVGMNQPRSIAGYVASRVVYGVHPYGNHVGGTIASVERIRRNDLVTFHSTFYRPDNAVLVFAGDIAAARAFDIAQATFGAWKGARPAVGTQEKRQAPVPGSLAPRVVVIDMPDAGQAAVVVTRAGVGRMDERLYAALVANSVLGGGYSSRLNQEIRIRRGLSYGATSGFDLRREPGPFTARAETKNESAAEVATIIVDEMSRLGASEIAAGELVPRKAVLIGNFGRSLETSSGLVARIATLAVSGQPLDEVNRYVSRVESVTPTMMREFATKELAGGASTVVIVGDAAKFLEPLKVRFTNVEVIPLVDLDLDAPGLRIVK